MTQLIQPRTNRLQLRQWISSDRNSFAAMSADPEVMRYFPKTLKRSESDSMAENCQALISERGWGVWAVELLETGEFIGIAGLNIPSAGLPCSPCVEVLWRLAPTHWGGGYATEGAEAALGVGFEQLNLPEIVSFAVVDNQRSRAVMERLGMANTGTIFNHPDVPNAGPLKKHCLYKISRQRWAGRGA